jgi:hypothetical protein
MIKYEYKTCPELAVIAKPLEAACDEIFSLASQVMVSTCKDPITFQLLSDIRRRVSDLAACEIPQALEQAQARQK